MFDDLMNKLDKIEPLLEIVNDSSLTAGAHFLAERIENPNSYVTFLGETSSGKSTLINGYKNILTDSSQAEKRIHLEVQNIVIVLKNVLS